MTIAAINITVQDTAIPAAPVAQQIPIVAGCSTLGTAATSPGHIVTCTTPKAVRDAFGYGPLATEAAYICQHGGVVRCLRLPSTNAGVAGAVTKTGSAGAGDMTVSAGTPNDRYDVRVEVLTTGALGTATIRYSLDHWADNPSPTWSDAIVVPANGEVILANTGMTVDFDDALGAGDVYDFSTTAPAPAAADITALNTNNVLSGFAPAWRFFVLAGQPATAAAAQLLAAALDPVLADLEDSGQRKIGILGSGRDAAADQDDITYEGLRLCFGYSEALVIASQPFTGFGLARIGIHAVIAGRAAASLMSTDPIRVATGQLPGVVAIAHNEFETRNVDDLKISTLRTYPGRSGYYVTNAWIKSAGSSSVRYLQHATVIANACETLNTALQRYVGASLRTKTDGTLSAADALDIERDITGTLESVIGSATRNVGPFNAEGTRGHASALRFTIDQTINLVSTDSVQGTLDITPLGYPRTFTFSVGFRLLANAA